MALDTSNTNPCGLLNSTSYPTVWLPSSASYTTTILESIATPRSAQQTLPAISLTQTAFVVSTTSPLASSAINTNSSIRLIKYMSKSTFANCLLPGGKTIIKDYTPNNYLNSDGTGPELDVKAVYDRLLADNILLKTEEIYRASDFGTTAPTIATTSLMYLYKLKQDGATGTELTNITSRITELENKNLRFFSAFLMEYCYYRTRYQYMLRFFFDVYKGTVTAATLTGLGINTTWIVKVMAMLNTKLVDMRRLLNEINEKYTAITTTIRQQINQAGVPGSNPDLQASIVALKSSAEEAKKYTTEAEFKKAAMDYAAEKNRYANIQLGLYAVLNIAALAMIFKLK